MIAASPEVDVYQRDLERLMDHGAGPDWLLRLRSDAWVRFQTLGFPTSRHEEWKYTSVRSITETPFLSAADFPDAEPSSLDEPLRADSVRLVFVNGTFRDDLSRLNGLSSGVVAGSLAAQLVDDPGSVRPHLEDFAGYRETPFAVLNRALFTDGAYIRIPANLAVESPIEIVYAAGAQSEPVAIHTRSLIQIESGGSATIVETFTGRDGVSYFSNSVTTILVDSGARLDHYKEEIEGRDALHIATQQLVQAANSEFRSHNITLGGRLIRNDVNARLAGEHIESTMNGLYVLNDRQHADNHTAIDHAMPNCNSHELYKGIMDGKSTGVFNGKIFVRQDAQKTDAKQTNQNLLLSEDAVIDTKPQLEIYADDVRCTHGATVGQLDSEALFYLRARGIGEQDARAMLVQAFARDLLDRVELAELREKLEARLLEKLSSQQHR